MRIRVGWTAAFLFASASATLAIAPPTVRIDDWNNDGVEDCNGTDQVDDTVCLQNAINAGRPTNAFPNYGTVEATSGARYLVSGTLTLRRAFGGVISGNGAVIEWRGTDPNVPLFLLEDTQQLEIRDLQIKSSPSFPLQTAFEFTNAPDDAPNPTWNVAPIANIIRHVYVQGTNLGGLEYGVRFSNRYGIDANNDQSTIADSTFANFSRAGISIEHTQSHQHRFFAVNAYAAGGNQTVCKDESAYDSAGTVCGASFVRLAGGGFSSVGGYRNGMRNAEYYLLSIYSPVTIIDSNSEGAARFLKTASGAAWFGHQVSVLGGRFAVNDLAPDGKVVEWNRQGPLSISGMVIDGNWPGPSNPVISFTPPGPPVGFTTNEGKLNVSSVYFHLNNSHTWDAIVLGTYGQFNGTGNMCFDTARGAVPCTGVAAGVGNVAGGLKVGTKGTRAAQVVCGNTDVDPPNIAKDSTGTATKPVADLAPNDACTCSPRADWDDDLILKYCYATAGTLNVKIYNAGQSATNAGQQPV